MANKNNIRDMELPNSLEAEKAVIGCIIQSKKSLSIALEMLSVDDFYYDANKEIFKVIVDLFNENTPVDIVTVGESLMRSDKLNAIGGIDYLTALGTGITTTENLSYYAKILQEKSLLRKLSMVSTKINSMSIGQEMAADILLAEAEKLLYEVASSREQKDLSPLRDIVLMTYEEIVENSKRTGKLTGIDTGFDELTYRTGGLHGGELILVGGRPGMGKSSFVVNIAEHVAIDDGLPVAIFNLEMSKTQIVQRILCSQAYIESSKIQLNQFQGDDWSRLGKCLDKIASAPMYIDDSTDISVADIHAKCQRLKQSHGLSLVIIDYLQLMQDKNHTESRQVEMSSISRALKVMAKELDVPVIALTQLSRASEKRPDKKPMMSDIRESGGLEQDADMIIFIYRDDYYNPDSKDKNRAEIIIAKHRKGSTGTFYLRWQGQYTKFLNEEYHAEEPNPPKEDE